MSDGLLALFALAVFIIAIVRAFDEPTMARKVGWILGCLIGIAATALLLSDSCGLI